MAPAGVAILTIIIVQGFIMPALLNLNCTGMHYSIT